MRLLLSAALAACLVTPALSREPDGPVCLTADVAMANVLQHPGVTAARLDGDEAEALALRINAMGTPTDFHASSVIIVLYPDRAAIGFFKACHEHDVAIALEAFADLWKSVRGVRV